MTITYQGGFNPVAFGVPGLYVNVQAPPAAVLPGAPSDIVGIVGTAIWGPKNSPVAFSDEAGAAAWFGPMQARKHDMMTQVHAAVMNGARNFRAVRVTDGTDLAASGAVQTNGITATSKHTGSGGNTIQVKVDAGSAPQTHKVTVMMPGKAPEVFDNITGTLNAAWVNIAAAINTGTTNRSASEIIVATAGASTTTPTYGTTTSLTGGTDGVTSVTSTTLVGVDTTPRTGMYALRKSGAAVFLLADADDSTTWAAQAAFALSEQSYAFGVSPSGDTISTFQATMASVAMDNPWFKAIFGDWVYMLDVAANRVRVVSPQGFLAGRRAAIGPHNSLLNKELYGIVGTQKSQANQFYSAAELQLIMQSRGEVIVMNSDGGAYPSAKFGRNSSSDKAKQGDNYTGMTNYLATSFDAAAGLGRFIGRLITPDQIREAQNTIGGFLQGEWDAERIGNAEGTIPYSVEVTAPQAAQGIEKATVMVQYLAVLEYFLLDFTGGQTVVIQSTLPLAA